MKFLDQAKVYIQSGNGGPGCISFRREAHVPVAALMAVMAAVVARSLLNARPGSTRLSITAISSISKLHRDRWGRPDEIRPSGPDIILKLPVGTQILNEDGDIVLADLTEIGQRITLARGGDGGRGNAPSNHRRISTAPR